MRGWCRTGIGQAFAFCVPLRPLLWDDRRAVTAVEYAFMGSVIGAVVVTAALKLNSGLSAAFQTIANAFPTWSP